DLPTGGGRDPRVDIVGRQLERSGGAMFLQGLVKVVEALVQSFDLFRRHLDNWKRQRLGVRKLIEHLLDVVHAKQQRHDHDEQQGQAADAAVEETATRFFRS